MDKVIKYHQAMVSLLEDYQAYLKHAPKLLGYDNLQLKTN
jgi:hypothetical protein